MFSRQSFKLHTSYRHYRFTFMCASNTADRWMHTAHNLHSGALGCCNLGSDKCSQFISLGLPPQFQSIRTTAPTAVSSQSEAKTQKHRRTDSPERRTHTHNYCYYYSCCCQNDVTIDLPLLSGWWLLRIFIVFWPETNQKQLLRAEACKG